MSNLRFKVGDQVRLAVWKPDDSPVEPMEVGTVVEVSTTSDAGNRFDYGIDFPSDELDFNCIDDWRLARLEPYAEPKSLTRTTEEETPA